MTIFQKIICQALGKSKLLAGQQITVDTAKASRIFFSQDPLCGAYGRIRLEKASFNLPDGIFINLDGTVRNNATSDEIADYVCKEIKPFCDSGISVELGGDSLSFLNIEDRFAIVKALSQLEKPPFCTLFECDYLTVEYCAEHSLGRPTGIFNDGIASYRRVLRIDLSLI